MVLQAINGRFGTDIGRKSILMRACRIPYGYKINPDWKHAFDPLISASAVDIAAFCGDSDGRYAYKAPQAPVSYQD